MLSEEDENFIKNHLGIALDKIGIIDILKDNKHVWFSISFNIMGKETGIQICNWGMYKTIEAIGPFSHNNKIKKPKGDK